MWGKAAATASCPAAFTIGSHPTASEIKSLDAGSVFVQGEHCLCLRPPIKPMLLTLMSQHFDILAVIPYLTPFGVDTALAFRVFNV